MRKEKKRKCSNDVSIPLQYLWCRAEKKKRRCSNDAKKKKTIRCSDDVSIPLQYLWQSAEKEEKKVQPNLYAMHAKCVIIIPKDIQLAHNTSGKDLITHPKPKMNYWA